MTCSIKKQYQADWYQQNKERLKEKARQYYTDNKQRHIETVKAWQTRNKEGIAQYKAEWYSSSYDANKGRYKAHCAKRRARILLRTPKWADMIRIKHMYSNCPEGYHVDHIVPLRGEKVSGLHVESNLQYLTAQDNLKKGNKHDLFD